MNVKELIEQLSNLNPNTMVVRNGYEGGVSEVTSVDEIKIALHVNTEWYYGEHANTSTGDTPAIFIG
jgi:preprotein translocase subunit YajC